MEKFHKNSENFISRKQEQALVELINPSNRILADVAKKIGVTERTLYNWLKNPHFQDRLRKERKRLLTQGIDNLRAPLNLAVRTLRRLMFSNDPIIKLKASQAILDYNFKLLDREKENKPKHPYDDLIDVEGEETVKSLHEKFLNLPKVQLENTKRMQEKWKNSGVDDVKIKVKDA